MIMIIIDHHTIVLVNFVVYLISRHPCKSCGWTIFPMLRWLLLTRCTLQRRRRRWGRQFASWPTWTSLLMGGLGQGGVEWSFKKERILDLVIFIWWPNSIEKMYDVICKFFFWCLLSIAMEIEGRKASTADIHSLKKLSPWNFKRRQHLMNT